ncbi:hypothetical protein CAEBREN_09469 [Caenorhabditis brenneri]|uniref:Uncharacterized protein n=1 Tax=Caenorhabditis brenneri TaxID=135651 RepID=G0NY62_CAEBE|nr:hypothetical protein CAEBREN_09469 [Caenorhabditis brenneri]
MKRKQMMSEDKEDLSRSSSEDDYDPRYLTREQRVALARARGGLMMLDMREREGYYASSSSAARPKRSKFNRKDSSRIVNLKESEKGSKEESEQHEKETESEEGKEGNDEENKPIGFEKLQKIKKDDGNRRGVDRIVPSVSNVTPDTIIYCQTSGAPIIKNKPLPCCTVFLKCPPCIEEARFRNFSNDWAGKVSNYQKNGLKMENFTSTRPHEFSVGQTVYETFRVHKMIMPRFRKIEDQINKGDFTNLTKEELNVYNVRYGIIKEDNRIKFSNIVRGGKIIQYFWQTDANVQQKTQELSIQKVLVNALNYLESNPFDQLVRMALYYCVEHPVNELPGELEPYKYFCYYSTGKYSVHTFWKSKKKIWFEITKYFRFFLTNH